LCRGYGGQDGGGAGVKPSQGQSSRAKNSGLWIEGGPESSLRLEDKPRSCKRDSRDETGQSDKRQGLDRTIGTQCNGRLQVAAGGSPTLRMEPKISREFRRFSVVVKQGGLRGGASTGKIKIRNMIMIKTGWRRVRV